jgi:hypothetical protein
VGNSVAWLPEREEGNDTSSSTSSLTTVLTAVDIKIETRFLIGIWKPTPISGVMLALTCYKSLLELATLFQ